MFGRKQSDIVQIAREAFRHIERGEDRVERKSRREYARKVLPLLVAGIAESEVPETSPQQQRQVGPVAYQGQEVYDPAAEPSMQGRFEEALMNASDDPDLDPDEREYIIDQARALQGARNGERRELS
jgi:hypothetical protein